ncbi:hypothetical protein HDU67_008058 [Dinochytrium kinnereticum]|nr:hypothetical protein HDU67_008058 [Dinochytrium kinnereticum]
MRLVIDLDDSKSKGKARMEEDMLFKISVSEKDTIIDIRISLSSGDHVEYSVVAQEATPEPEQLPEGNCVQRSSSTPPPHIREIFRFIADASHFTLAAVGPSDQKVLQGPSSGPSTHPVEASESTENEHQPIDQVQTPLQASASATPPIARTAVAAVRVMEGQTAPAVALEPPPPANGDQLEAQAFPALLVEPPPANGDQLEAQAFPALLVEPPPPANNEDAIPQESYRCAVTGRVFATRRQRGSFRGHLTRRLIDWRAHEAMAIGAAV